MSLTVNIETESSFSLEKETKNALRQLTQFAGVIDVTQYTIKSRPRHRSHSENTLLRSFLQTIPDAFVITASAGSINCFNERAEILFGYKTSEVAGQPISLLFEPDFAHELSLMRDRPLGQPAWRCLTARRPIKGRKKNGELFAVEILQTHGVFEGQPVLIYCVKDISDRVRHEQQIAGLEREVAFLSRHSMLGELATAITHELSQPLTAITNYTEAASRYWKKSPAEDIESGLALIAKAGDQAKRAWLIMHRLRQLLQHRGGDFVQEDLRLAVEDAIQLATLGAAQHGITVTVDLPAEPVMVRMDRVQIQILIANLIRNAVDELSVTEGERRVWITLKTSAEGLADVSVTDSGHGIAADVFENIFEPFLTTKPQGLGVGLAVSRRIAQAHGARLAAENRPEGGAVFSFIVPVSVNCSSECK